MKILLDEHFGQDVATLLSHVAQIYTARSMGFAGMPNGELLKAAAGSGRNSIVWESARTRATICVKNYGVTIFDDLPKRFHVLAYSNPAYGHDNGEDGRQLR